MIRTSLFAGDTTPAVPSNAHQPVTRRDEKTGANEERTNPPKCFPRIKQPFVAAAEAVMGGAWACPNFSQASYRRACCRIVPLGYAQSGNSDDDGASVGGLWGRISLRASRSAGSRRDFGAVSPLASARKRRNRPGATPPKSSLHRLLCARELYERHRAARRQGTHNQFCLPVTDRVLSLACLSVFRADVVSNKGIPPFPAFNLIAAVVPGFTRRGSRCGCAEGLREDCHSLSNELHCSQDDS